MSNQDGPRARRRDSRAANLVERNFAKMRPDFCQVARELHVERAGFVRFQVEDMQRAKLFVDDGVGSRRG